MDSLTQAASGLHHTFNYAEAAVWGVAAAICLAYGTRRHGSARSQCVAAATAFAVFAVSDLIEVRTGAWWRPWWLLLMKGACLAVLLPLFCLWWRNRRRPRQEADTARNQ